MLNKIYNQDCLIGMKDIPDKSIDMILCDLPYGTTAIACINTNRNYIGYEMDKTYFDLATKRVQDHKLAKSGNVGLFAEPKQGELF